MPYDQDFIPGVRIPLPALSDELRASAFAAGAPIEHTRFSIVFNQIRGFAVLTAHNVDGNSIIGEGTIKRKSFVLDPDVPRHIQVTDKRGYHKNPWDRGHLVRRRSLHWGNVNQATTADRESSYWTNIAPQHERLHDTAWGEIEDFIFDIADDDNRRAAVFQAPVLTPRDPEHQNKPDREPIQIPAGFWKIIAIRHKSELRAAAFLVWQRDFDKPEPETFDPVLEQVRVTTIEFLTGLTFPQVLRDADPFHFSPTRTASLSARARRGRAPQTRSAPPPQTRPTFIRSASDICL